MHFRGQACTLPYAEFCDAAFSCAGNHLPSLLSDVSYEVSWWIVAPALSLVLAIAADVGLIFVRRLAVRPFTFPSPNADNGMTGW